MEKVGIIVTLNTHAWLFDLTAASTVNYNMIFCRRSGWHHPFLSNLCFCQSLPCCLRAWNDLFISVCLSVSGFLQIPLNLALVFWSMLTMVSKLFVLSLLNKQTRTCPLLSNPSLFSTLLSLPFLFMTISSKQSTVLDVFLWSSLYVPEHLFLIRGVEMFVQPPADTLCGLKWKVLRQRNVKAGWFFMIWMQSQKMLALCHKLSRFFSAFGQQKFWVLRAYMAQEFQSN